MKAFLLVQKNSCGTVGIASNEDSKASGSVCSKTHEDLVNLTEISEMSQLSDTSEDVENKIGDNEVLDYLYQQKESVAGSGWSASVFKVIWKGAEVALKVWNGSILEGHLELKAEVEMYRFIRDNIAFLLGTAIENLIEARMLSDDVGLYGATAAFAIEFVGSGLFRDCRGCLWSTSDKSYQRLGANDERKIYCAALKSLRELHEKKIVHGGAALRNIRVENLCSTRCEWKAWWIDLGKSIRLIKSELSTYHYEECDCSRLFPKVASQVVGQSSRHQVGA